MIYRSIKYAITQEIKDSSLEACYFKTCDMLLVLHLDKNGDLEEMTQAIEGKKQLVFLSTYRNSVNHTD